MLDRFEVIRQQYPIKQVALDLGMEIKGDLTRCFNTVAHKNGDAHPSLHLMQQANRYECKACGVKGSNIDLVMQLKGCTLIDAAAFIDPSFSEPPTTSMVNNIEPSKYLASRGINDATATKFGLKLVKHNGIDAVAIPLPTGTKYRLLSGDIRYIQDKGTTATLFKTKEAARQAILCEGEFDAFILDQETGYPAWTGTTGKGTFLQEWVSQFSNFEKIFIAYDNDEAGEDGARKVASMLGEDRCYRVKVPQELGKDWTDYFLHGKKKDDFDQLLREAIPMSQLSNLLARFKAKKVSSGEKIETGLISFDQQTGGLRVGNAYLLAGLKECGKTALLLTIVNHMLLNGQRVGYVDTELGLTELAVRMGAVYNKKSTKDIEDNLELAEEWLSIFQGYFSYAGVDDAEDLRSDGKLSFEKVLQRIDQFISKGSRVIVVDNLTTFSVNPATGKKGWEVLSGCMQVLMDIAKKRNVLVLFVVHTKEELIYSETAPGITKMLSEDKAGSIFEKSVTICAKPDISDVLGGTASHSQISGGVFLLWRPYQKFHEEKYSRLSQLIIASLRHDKASNIKLLFHGEKSTFEEISEVLEEQEIDEN